MATNTIKFVSMNCQGLSNTVKRADTLNFLRGKNHSVYFLQDTHFTTNEEKYIRTMWGFECFFSNFSSQSRGVAIMFNNNFEFQVHKIHKDETGNKLILDITLEGKRLTLINIYGPNKDNPNFYKEILSFIKETNNPVIIAGDFNLILDSEYDAKDYININNPKARDEVLNLMIECNLVDCWRELHLEVYQYTWRKKNTDKQARLDYFLISESLFMDVVETKIMPGYKTDHSLVFIEFDFGKFTRGKSFWKFNNSLLKDKKYVEEIKKTIEDTKTIYFLKSEDQTENETINDIPIQDIKLNIEDSLFFDVLLMEIRGKTISYSSHKTKMEIDKEKQILEEIEKIENETNIDFDDLETKRQELYELRQKKMEGVKIRSRARWISEGEKTTKYFCNLEKRNFISKCMNSLKKDNGTIINDQSEIVLETMRYYKNLYKKRDCVNTNLADLLDTFIIPKLNDSDNLKLEGPIRYSEILFCLKKASNNTSPGFDGFTYEFFKFFWNDIGYFLLRAINTSFSKGELSESLRRGVITCLPKGNKDKLFLKNWRPISLLNTSYKLASACIAERLKQVLPKLINEDQTGFISGRFIGENIKLLYDIMNYTENNKLPGMLVLIDFEKAFDSVSWDFLFKVLDYFNFKDSFKKWVQMFYKHIQSCVIVNGHLSDWFYLERGCRQGDPLSPYLFILCAEILAILIRNDNDINGIKMGDTTFVISQYADDTSILLDGSKKSLEKCLSILKLYARASGLCINIEKTKVVWIGSEKHSNRRFCEDYELCWEENEFTVLGVKFTKNLSDIVEVNYRIKIDEMKKIFLNWSKRILTPLGRITVIKSLALPKINHLILSIPNPSEKMIKEIQTMFYDYLWNHGPDKIKRTLISQNYNRGGLRMVDIEKFILSLKLTWLRRIILNPTKYLSAVNRIFPVLTECLKFGSAFINERRSNIENKFWCEVLCAYKVFTEKLKCSNWKEFLCTSLWYNIDIKVGGATVYYKSWKEKGIMVINDLVDIHGEFLSFENFQRKYSIHTHFLQYEGFIRSLKNYMLKYNISHTEERDNINGPVRSLSIIFILKDKKGCRGIYDKLVYNEIVPTSLLKWQTELNLNRNFVWKKVLHLPFHLVKDTNMRWFQTRINHRILGTNYLLRKMNLKTNDKCTFCSEEKETLVHLFWECEHVQYFWNSLKLLLIENCGFENVSFIVTDIVFGNPAFDEILNVLLLYGKKFIYRMKMEGKIPSFIGFQKNIAYQYKIDRHISRLSQKQKEFETKWEKYKELFQ